MNDHTHFQPFDPPPISTELTIAGRIGAKAGERTVDFLYYAGLVWLCVRWFFSAIGRMLHP